jgi:hypothetical protein
MKVIILLSRSPSPGREIRNGNVTERILSGPRNVELVFTHEKRKGSFRPMSGVLSPAGAPELDLLRLA